MQTHKWPLYECVVRLLPSVVKVLQWLIGRECSACRHSQHVKPSRRAAGLSQDFPLRRTGPSCPVSDQETRVICF